MKKILIITNIIILLAIISFFSFHISNKIKDSNSLSNITAIELFNKIQNSIELPSMSERNSNDLELRYGISIEKIEDFKYMYNNTSYYVDTIAIFNAKDNKTLNAIKASLETILTHTKTSMQNYDAEQYKIAESGEVFTKGNFVFLIMSPQINEIKNIINDNL